MRSYQSALSPLTLALSIVLASSPARGQDTAAVDEPDVLVTSPASAAPNLLVNSNFTIDLAGWLQSTGSGHGFAWSSSDSGGNPQSGSARIVNSANAAGRVTLRQCFAVTSGNRYVAGGLAWLAAGAPSGSQASVSIDFYSAPSCVSTNFLGGNSGASAVVGVWSRFGRTATVPQTAVSVAVSFSALKGTASPTPLTVYFDKLYFREGRCADDSTQLCLNGARFQVLADWRTIDGTSGDGGSVPFTTDSGSFWFFDPSNIELNVKVLDACGLNGRYWVFVAGTTNVQVNLYVIDTKTGTVKTYTNPQGHVFTTITDVNAFAACP